MTRALSVLALVLTVVLGPGSARPASAVAEHRHHPRVVTLDGVRVRLEPGTRQVVTVNAGRGFHAVLTYWRLDEKGSPGPVLGDSSRGRAGLGSDGRSHDGWQAVRTTTAGRTGYGGLVPGDRRHQGTGTTPLGTYGLISAFGTHRRGARALDYRQIRPGDFWVEDNTSRFYNRYRNQRQGGFHWRTPTSRENGSERLSDYPTQYEYAIVTSFNLDQVRHRGAGIFLHVNGSGATAGCVSAPRSFLRMLFARLDPARHPLIAIGR